MSEFIYKPIVLCGIFGCKKYKALVDTGSSFLIVSPTIAAKLGAIITGNKALIEAVADQKTYEVSEVMFTRVSFEGCTAENVRAYVLDNSFGVIVGIDLLRKCELVKDIEDGMMFYY